MLWVASSPCKPMQVGVEMLIKKQKTIPSFYSKKLFMLIVAYLK